MPFIVDGTNGGFFPSWTTATRPASPSAGQMGYNTTTGAFDAYTAAGWVSVASSATAPVNGPAFFATSATNQTGISNATFTKIIFATENYDTNNNFASSTFTPTVAGYYQISGGIDMGSGTVTTALVRIYKNGGNIFFGAGINGGSTTEFYSSVSGLVYCNGTTDYIELYAYLTTSSNIIYVPSTFCGFLARAA
jgi:hypothetical protein